MKWLASGPIMSEVVAEDDPHPEDRAVALVALEQQVEDVVAEAPGVAEARPVRAARERPRRRAPGAPRGRRRGSPAGPGTPAAARDRRSGSCRRPSELRPGSGGSRRPGRHAARRARGRRRRGRRRGSRGGRSRRSTPPLVAVVGGVTMPVSSSIVPASFESMSTSAVSTAPNVAALATSPISVAPRPCARRASISSPSVRQVGRVDAVEDRACLVGQLAVGNGIGVAVQARRPRGAG